MIFLKVFIVIDIYGSTKYLKVYKKIKEIETQYTL